MADNQNIPNQAAGQSSMHNDLEARFHWLRQEFLPKHGTKILVVVALIVAGVVGYSQYSAKSKAAELALNEDLGKGFDLMARGQADSAGVVLEALVANVHASKLQQAKAALLVGNLKFQQNNYDAAAKYFQLASNNAGDAVVIKSGAEHGLATVAIEKKEYDKAAQLLEAFVSAYGKRSGDLEARYSKKEAIDPVTTVPDALWKLTLVYSELKKNDQAKASAEKLLKIYGTSREATSAQKFLATI